MPLSPAQSLLELAPNHARHISVLQVLRLEGRTRSLEEGISGGGVAWAAAVDGLSKARVALTLKTATNRRQQDIVRNIQAEVTRVSKKSMTSFGFYGLLGDDRERKSFAQDSLF